MLVAPSHPCPLMTGVPVKGVYCLESPSSKKYVGIGVGRKGVKSRWWMYRNGYTKAQPALHSALRKYGPDNFRYTVLLPTDDPDVAKRAEMYLIDVWGLQSPARGYNITPGGDGRLGVRHSPESVQKMRANRKYRNHSLETRRRISVGLRGKVQSVETRQRHSKAVKGVLKGPFSSAHCSALSAAHTGKKQTEEVKARMRLAQKARWNKLRQDPEQWKAHCARMRPVALKALSMIHPAKGAV